MSVFLLILGFLLMGAGAFLVVRILNQYRDGLIIKARIIDVKVGQQTVTTSEGVPVTRTFYYPVFEYSFGEKDYVAQSQEGFKDSKLYVTGGEIEIAFKKDHPEKAKVTNFLDLYLIPIILLLVGIIFFISALII
jgi:hypothetical protein